MLACKQKPVFKDIIIAANYVKEFACFPITKQPLPTTSEMKSKISIN